jgi:hypothetical protein
MGGEGRRASRRATRERRDRGRVGVDELAQRAEAGQDLWTGAAAGGGRPGPAGAGRRWTAEEDELVRSLSPEEAAARTGRTLLAVKARRRALRAGGAG